MCRGWKGFEELGRKTLECLEEIVGRDMDMKGNSGAGLRKKREELRRIENTFYRIQISL